MKQKIIFLSFTQLTDRISRDWYIDFLLEKNFEIEYWDITSLFYEDNNKFYLKNSKIVKIINTYSDLLIRINELDEKCNQMIVNVSLSLKFLKIYTSISKKNIKLYFIAQGALPSFTQTTKSKIVNHILHPFRLVYITYEQIVIKIFFIFKIIKHYDVVFSVGDVYFKNYYLNSKKIIPINLSDYDNYKLNFKVENNIKHKYALFLDINATMQNDIKSNNLQNLNKDNYFKSLNLFFKFLEIKYNLEIIIAAHPTTPIDFIDFCGRSIFRMNTDILTRDAEFVITHHSTSLSYAILNYKKICFIYTNEMLKIYKETVIKHIIAQSTYLNVSNVNIDTFDQKSFYINEINYELYNRYKYDFLTSKNSENFMSKDIVFNELVNII